MSLTSIVLTGRWTKADGSPAAGSVVVGLTESITNSSQPVAQVTGFAYLRSDGSLYLPVFANNDVGTNPTGSQYYCTLDLVGSPRTAGYVVVPAAPPGSRTITDGVVVLGSATLTSATAAFTSGDVGVFVYSADLPVGATIQSVTSGTVVVLSVPATASASGQTVLIGASVSLPSLLAA